MIKRAFDITAVLLALPVLLPMMAAVAVAVWLDTRGPILFRQVRVGLGGRDFILVKFRTMTVRAGSERGSFDPGDASRVTRVGRWLRASKLDELPQVWNVLRGEMSLVGPRPEVRRWVREFPECWAIAHTVRPGITDPASIVYRHEEQIFVHSLDPESTYRDEILPRKLDLYAQYVRTWTFRGDLAILIRTIAALVSPAPRSAPASRVSIGTASLPSNSRS